MIKPCNFVIYRLMVPLNNDELTQTRNYFILLFYSTFDHFKLQLHKATHYVRKIQCDIELFFLEFFNFLNF
jgi:hypothetical protein